MHLQIDRRRQLAAERRQQRAHAVGDFDRVRSRLLLHGQDEARFAAVPSHGLIVFDVIHDFAELAETNGMSVAIRDDDLRIVGRFEELSVRLHRVVRVRAGKDTGGKVDVVCANRAHDFVDADAARGQLARIELRAHCVLLRAIHLHLRHSLDCRDP